jgi:molybdopterin synthase sulfur carrier subunit
MKVKFFATYRNFTKCNEENVPATPDVWTLLEYFGERYGADLKAELFTPDFSEIGDEAIILVNGRNVHHLDGKNTKLSETDVVSLFPTVAGG